MIGGQSGIFVFPKVIFKLEDLQVLFKFILG